MSKKKKSGNKAKTQDSILNLVTAVIKERQKMSERPQDRYNREKTTVVNIRLVKSTEADIIAQLEKQPNKSSYIKTLIRADIAKNRSTE